VTIQSIRKALARIDNRRSVTEIAPNTFHCGNGFTSTEADQLRALLPDCIVTSTFGYGSVFAEPRASRLGAFWAARRGVSRDFSTYKQRTLLPISSTPAPAHWPGDPIPPLNRKQKGEIGP
jgi:hypothetical protein